MNKTLCLAGLLVLLVPAASADMDIEITAANPIIERELLPEEPRASIRLARGLFCMRQTNPALQTAQVLEYFDAVNRLLFDAELDAGAPRQSALLSQFRAAGFDLPVMRSWRTELNPASTNHGALRFGRAWAEAALSIAKALTPRQYFFAGGDAIEDDETLVFIRNDERKTVVMGPCFTEPELKQLQAVHIDAATQFLQALDEAEQSRATGKFGGDLQ